MIATEASLSHRPLLQRGFGLIEVMIAITIGTLVIAGLFGLLYNLVVASNSTTGLTQLQDNERIAMMALQNSVQNAGYMPMNYYFSTANTQTARSMLSQSAGSYATAGQFLGGSNGSSDALWVRYVSGSGPNGLPDNVTDCVGRSYTPTGASGTMLDNAFFVDSSGNLSCTVKTSSGQTTTYPIVGGVSSLQVFFGIENSSASTGTGSVAQYVTATNMPAGGWVSSTSSSGYARSLVRSVKFVLNFVNPLYKSASATPGQPATITSTFIVYLNNSPTRLN